MNINNISDSKKLAENFSERLRIFSPDNFNFSDFSEILVEENLIFSEFKSLDYFEYKKIFTETLDNYLSEYKNNKKNNNIFLLTGLRNYLKNKKPKIGLYAGSFCPFHFGHLNILEKAENIFDKVIIARGKNPEKFSGEEKFKTISNSVLNTRQFDEFEGFLTDYIKQKEQVSDITLIRGLRSGYDLDYEVNQLRFMSDMNKNIRVIFIHCDKEFEHISSSFLRNLEKIKENSSKKYIPD